MSYADYPQTLQNIEHFGGKTNIEKKMVKKTNIVEHNTNKPKPIFKGKYVP